MGSIIYMQLQQLVDPWWNVSSEWFGVNMAWFGSGGLNTILTRIFKDKIK